MFLVSRQIIEATINGDLSLIQYYPQAFLDDVTNMTWDHFNQLRPGSIQDMYRNLFRVYRQIFEPDQDILSPEARDCIRQMDPMKCLMLKDEIIYFALRLPYIDHMAFFEYAAKPERIDHPIVELGLAYGIGMTRSHPFALQFAKKLRPGTTQELLNRSWTVAFFGDQEALNIYDFIENPVNKWDIARNARLKRFQKDTEKAYRYRIFDIPLLFCFYTSRSWKGCLSAEDLEIIRNCSIDWPYYTAEERAFLKEQKDELVSQYALHLNEDKQQPALCP